MSAPANGSAPDDPHLHESLRARVRELEAENAVLRDNDAEWRRLLETMPQIVWITRPDGWHTHFNRQWMEFTGLTLEESLGHGWNPPFHPEDRARAAARWDEATRTGEPYEIEYRLRRADGEYHWMLGRAMPLRDDEGRIVKWFGTCTDIEELKQALSRIDEQARLLEQRATTDPLTGLGNRTLLFDRLEFLLSQRNRTGLAVAFLDLNDFKDVNDERGHGFGDQLLAVVGARLRAAMRQGDVVTRLGGDEFVVLGDADGEQAALELAGRLEDTVAGTVSVEGVAVNVSASVGVTYVSPDDPAPASTVLSRADEAMYDVKRRGIAARSGSASRSSRGLAPRPGSG
jgi:diguanylate cyclase (GGDEF)-like protein/PAS domain S-box-containing protein